MSAAPARRGQDVAAEIVAALVVGGVAVQLAQQRARGEDVVAHGGVDAAGIAGNGGRVGVLLVEAEDAAVRRGLDHAELARRISGPPEWRPP